MDLKLVQAVDSENPIVGDLQLVNGQLVLTATLAEVVAQRLRIRFQFFKGEWFANPDEGFPFFQDVFVKAPDLGRITDLFRDAIMGVNGVASITSLSILLVAGTRTLNVVFIAALTDGTTLSSADFKPFTVGL